MRVVYPRVNVPRADHRWSVSPRRAAAIQRRLAGRVSTASPRRPLRLAAAVDCAYSSDGSTCFAGVVLWDLELARELERRVARRAVRFPYVPGLLSFREAPAALAALRKLSRSPDVLLCDGHGLAHPRRFGLACHVGVTCGVPTIGCAKRRHVGAFREPGRRRGSRAPLLDQGEVVGSALRTRHGVRPVFVSVGHLIDLPTAERIVLRAATRYRLPEPARLADQLAAGRRRAGRAVP